MIYELNKEEYKKIIPLLSNNGYSNVVIKSIIDGNTRGKIFVDNIENPKTALVWAIYCMYYFLGDGNNSEFFSKFHEFIKNELYPMNKELGCDTFIATIIEDQNFEKNLDFLLKDKNHEKGYTQTFKFDIDIFLKKNSENFSSDSNYIIKKIDFTQKNNVDQSELVENILEFWPTTDSFSNIGSGFYLEHDNKIVSSCFSCGVSKNLSEIVINTYEESYRKKGFGEIVAMAFINECIEKNMIPSWETDESNIPSIRLAEKVGFKKDRKLLCYEFLFDAI